RPRFRASSYDSAYASNAVSLVSGLKGRLAVVSAWGRGPFRPGRPTPRPPTADLVRESDGRCRDRPAARSGHTRGPEYVRLAGRDDRRGGGAGARGLLVGPEVDDLDQDPGDQSLGGHEQPEGPDQQPRPVQVDVGRRQEFGDAGPEHGERTHDQGPDERDQGL